MRGRVVSARSACWPALQLPTTESQGRHGDRFRRLRRRRPSRSGRDESRVRDATSLFRNLGGGLFAERTVESGIGPTTLPYVGFGVVFLDYDNDARLDLAIANGHVVDNTAQFRSGRQVRSASVSLSQYGNRRFVDVSRSAGPGFAVEKVGRHLSLETSTTTATSTSS